MELQKLCEVVEDILERYEHTRSSDGDLYLKVCSMMNSKALTMPFGEVLLNMKELNIPRFESVRRCRQKLQAKRPELCATDIVEGYRVINERKYRMFAKEKR